jgi:hypothetical protein
VPSTLPQGRPPFPQGEPPEEFGRRYAAELGEAPPGASWGPVSDVPSSLPTALGATAPTTPRIPTPSLPAIPQHVARALADQLVVRDLETGLEPTMVSRGAVAPGASAPSASAPSAAVAPGASAPSGATASSEPPMTPAPHAIRMPPRANTPPPPPVRGARRAEPPESAPSPPADQLSPYQRAMQRCARDIVEQALIKTGGNKRRASTDLGLSRAGLYHVLSYGDPT